jgi:SAM-dependent methyltransferase
MGSESRRTGLLDDVALEASAVVANCAMNRERQLAGVNSYTRELGFSPLDVMAARLTGTRGSAAGGPGAAADAGEPPAVSAGWLDLCCGTGRALIQAGARLRQAGLGDRVVLVGVDLAGGFDAVPPESAGVELVCASVTSWAPGRAFDLITCVHGLHYVGDKLSVLTRAASWLTADGRLVADLDLSAIRLADGRPAARRLTGVLRAAGFDYDPRRHRVSCTGRREVSLPYAYVGADDHAGPGYTGQPAVHSHYAQCP